MKGRRSPHRKRNNHFFVVYFGKTPEYKGRWCEQ
jgi:hypothetical protein